MCGIIGELAFGQRSAADWPALLQLMARRGPDDAGFWQDGPCTFGFRRLSVLDLSTEGSQPKVHANGGHALVFNGEVYNFRELREELCAAGHRFSSSGDAEVVLKSLVQWGRDALDRFNGMFAIAYWNAAGRRLLLARDPAGIKPLYYIAVEQGVAFASQYDQLLRHPYADGLSISGDALALYLRLGYVPPGRAILRRTSMLQPGSWIEFGDDGSATTGRHFEFPRSSQATLRGEAAVEAVDEAVSRAVRRQLVSDVPVGTFLSGGIDSPLVAAKMRHVAGQRVRAFTIGTTGDSLDESTAAAAYAQELDLDHVIEHVTATQALALVDDVVQACGEPFADYSIFPTMLVSRIARRHVKVMLSGDGGDELFLGYAGRFASVLRRAAEFRQSLWLRSARWAARKHLRLGTAEWNLRWPTIGQWYRAKHTRLPENLLRAILPDVPAWPADFDLFDYAGSNPDETAQWLRWNEFTGHLGMVLLKVDRASMHESLEVRVPLLDREVIDVALRVDWRSCLDPVREIGKLPLRRSLSREVSYQTTEKRGFSVPMADWLRGALRNMFRDVVLERDALVGMPLDRPALEKVFRAHERGEQDIAWGLWTLLSLALWEDTHLRNRFGAVAPQRTP